MIDVQRHVFGIAVGALASPLRQQIFANLTPCQRASLVLDARDLRILHQLHVESNQLLHDGRNRREAPQARDRCHHGVDAVAQGWREPSFGLAPVVEARRAVAKLRRTAAPAEGRALLQGLADRRAAVLDLDQRNHGGGRFGLAHDGDAGLLRARIEFQSAAAGVHRLRGRSGRMVNGYMRWTRARPRSSSSRARFSEHGMNGFFVLTENKHGHVVTPENELPLRAL